MENEIEQLKRQVSELSKKLAEKQNSPYENAINSIAEAMFPDPQHFYGKPLDQIARERLERDGYLAYLRYSTQPWPQLLVESGLQIVQGGIIYDGEHLDIVDSFVVYDPRRVDVSIEHFDDLSKRRSAINQLRSEGWDVPFGIFPNNRLVAIRPLTIT